METEVLEQRLPDTRDSGLMYSIAAVLFIFVGGLLADAGLPDYLYVVLSEVLIIALPPILLAKARHLSIRQTFRLKMPRPVEVLLTLMIGPVMLIAATCAGLVALILIRNAFGSLLISDGVTPLMSKGIFWSVFLVGVVPAVCEELLFRGFIQRGLERMGVGWAIFLSGLLFGLFHFDFQRFAAQTLIGLVSAYMVYRTGSIFCGMLLHFMNNGLITLITYYSLKGIEGTDLAQQMADPFESSEFAEIAEQYGMSVPEFLNSLILPAIIIFIVCLVVIFGLLVAVRNVTAEKVKLPVRNEKAAGGLLLGIPGLVLVLLVYTAIGLMLAGNPAGTAILRLLGL